MKKILVVLLGVVLAAAALSLTSCQKDIDNAKSLAGTTWIAVTAKMTPETTHIITFKDQYTFELKISSYGESDRVYDGTFVITGSKSGLTGASIAFAAASLEEGWGLGKFESENKLVVNNLEFTRVLNGAI